MEVFKDKRLLCIECKNRFPFTALEQERYMKKGLKVPKRCVQCRKAKKERYKKKREDFIKELGEREVKVKENVCLRVIPA